VSPAFLKHFVAQSEPSEVTSRELRTDMAEVQKVRSRILVIDDDPGFCELLRLKVLK